MRYILTILLLISIGFAQPRTLFWVTNQSAPCGTNNGTLSAGVTWSADVPTGLASNVYSASFDGGASALIATGTNTFSATAGSLSIWFKPVSFDKVILSSSTDADARIQIYSNGITVRTNGNTDHIRWEVPTLSAGTWYNIIITRSSNIIKLYLGGTEITNIVEGDNTLAGNINLDYLGQWYLYNGNIYQYDGKLSSFRMFDAVLTSTDISNLASGNRSVTNSRLHLRMKEGTGTIAYDYCDK